MKRSIAVVLVVLVVVTALLFLASGLNELMSGIKHGHVIGYFILLVLLTASTSLAFLFLSKADEYEERSRRW